jgi:hypothetical protein
MYVVQNPNVFTAAFSGTLTGMGAGRVLSLTSPAAYSGMVAIANAFAQSFGTQWGPAAVATLEVEVITEACQGFWQGRNQLNPPPSSLLPSTWTQECQAIIAMVQEALALYTAQGYPNPPVGGGVQWQVKQTGLIDDFPSGHSTHTVPCPGFVANDSHFCIAAIIGSAANGQLLITGCGKHFGDPDVVDVEFMNLGGPLTGEFVRLWIFFGDLSP